MRPGQSTLRSAQMTVLRLVILASLLAPLLALGACAGLQPMPAGGEYLNPAFRTYDAE
jgi:hypothetical protein